MADKCQGCHTEGTTAPFALDDYASASAMAPAALAAIEAGRMPPWLAQQTDECDPAWPYKDDLRLSTEEIEMFRAWIDQGTPEGDADRAAPLPQRAGMEIASPDLELEFPVAYTVEGTTDDFQCFVLDPGNTVPMWITASQLIPGNSKVAHHGLIFVDYAGASAGLSETGVFPCFSDPGVEAYQISTWTPGMVPNYTPAGAGTPVPVGARIVVQMHYHPSPDGPEVDQSRLQLSWTDQTPTWEAAHALVGNFDEQEDNGYGLLPGPNDDGPPIFRIPANAVDHTEEMIYFQEIDFDIPIYTVGTHMHYVGTDMKIDFIEGGEEKCLIQTPKWDFNWQRTYDIDAEIADLPTISIDEELRMRCTYNNSMANPFVADALAEQGISEPHDVFLGEETLDEMCLGIFGILLPPGLLTSVF